MKKNAPAVPAVVPISAPFSPETLITIEELAKRLHNTEAWVREKCRRWCPNPIPVMNAGRHLLFDWVQVSEWLRTLPRPTHVRHVRRKKSERNEHKTALKVAA